MHLFCPLTLVAFASLAMTLAGCSGGSALSGKFYENDGPPESFEPTTPNDITPRVERPHKAANRPYTVMGKRYYPMTGDAPFTQIGVASWYGKQFHGRKTAIGERYDMFSLSAAHPTMELPSFARVTNLENGRSVLVRVNDRGPFLGGRAIDMSYAAAMRLGYHKAGTAHVKIERLTRQDIAAGRISEPAEPKPLEDSTPISSPSPTQEASEADENNTSPTVSMPLVSPHTVRETPLLKEEPILSTQAPITDPIGALIEMAPPASSVTEIPLENGAVISKSSSVPTPQDPLAPLLENPIASSLPTWSCQIGAYGNEDSAKDFAAHAEMMLSENRLAVPVKVIAEGKLYRVLVGAETDKMRARLTCEKINTILGLKAFLIQR